MIPFPKQKYDIIYADPPWEVKAGPEFHSNGKSRLLTYPTMTIDEIKKMPIHSICNKNSVLFLWVINKYIFQSYEIAKFWGFNPITLLTWCKNPMGLGLGGAFVQTSEHLLYCKRGRGIPVLKRFGSSWFNHKRGKHSKKPDFIRDVIVETFGNRPRIELFARNYTNGWDVWGNEVNVTA